MNTQRAWARMEVRAVQDTKDQRTFEGVATTPSTDRQGDIIDPLGAKFKNPLPLLHQHNSDEPIGTVKFQKATPEGISFVATIAQVAEPGPLQDRLNTAWGEIKLGLVRAVSIGFRILDGGVEALKDGSGGLLFKAIEIMELSTVTIPANSEATINVIRSFDTEAQAATGRDGPEPDARPAPRSGTTQPRTKEGRKMPKTIAEQISAFEATRQAKAAQMSMLMEQSGEEGATLDAAQSEEYDALEAEVSEIDKHLVRLRSMQKVLLTQATPVAEAIDARTASEVRGGAAVPAMAGVRVVSTVPKGTAFTRYAMALMAAKGDLGRAAHLAKGEAAWASSTPEVAQVLEAQYGGADLERIMRAAVAAGTATDAVWAGPLVQYNIMASEFVDLLRPATIIGRIPGLRHVPFNVKIPRQTAGSSVGWVGEGNPKPVSSLAFDNITLRWAKAAGIVVLTDELVRFSNPSAEALVQSDLIQTIAQFLDQAFTDPAKAAVANVSPASITNGLTALSPSGADADAFHADMATLIATFTNAMLSTASAVLLMTETQAAAIGMMRTPLGTYLYPTLNAQGGTLLGMPVVTSQNAGMIDSTDVPPSGRIVMLKADEILLADDGQVLLDASREASLQMDSAPMHPTDATTVFMSLWQNNMVGLRAERWINWEKRRPGCVAYINDAKYL